MQRKRKKSLKRAKSARRLARSLPRDAQGKFLPRGSKNLFRKRKRRKSLPAKLKTKKKTMARRRAPRGPKVITTDQFPNFLTGKNTTQGAADPNTLISNTIFTPIPRLKTLGNRATVMELLWVDLATAAIFKEPDQRLSVVFSLGTRPLSILEFNDPRVFVFQNLNVNGSGVTATRGGLFIRTLPWRYSFQTQNGFGYLMASDSFHVTMKGEGLEGGIALTEWKLFYRFVEIPLAEFVGLVQSTQQS